MHIDPLIIYAVIGAVAGVLIPYLAPLFLKKAKYPVLDGISAVGKVAEQVVGKGKNGV